MLFYHVLSTSAPNTYYISSSNSSYQGTGFLFRSSPGPWGVWGTPRVLQCLRLTRAQVAPGIMMSSEVTWETSPQLFNFHWKEHHVNSVVLHRYMYTNKYAKHHVVILVIKYVNDIQCYTMIYNVRKHATRMFTLRTILLAVLANMLYIYIHYKPCIASPN